jgi:hypothetical protein
VVCLSPGVDTSVLRTVASEHSYEKLLGMHEVMRFVDRDASLADVFRNPSRYRAPK